MHGATVAGVAGKVVPARGAADGGEKVNQKEEAEFARRFVEAFKESDEMQQMVLDFIC